MPADPTAHKCKKDLVSQDTKSFFVSQMAGEAFTKNPAHRSESANSVITVETHNSVLYKLDETTKMAGE